mgnify:CR=1 FL=1
MLENRPLSNFLSGFSGSVFQSGEAPAIYIPCPFPLPHNIHIVRDLYYNKRNLIEEPHTMNEKAARLLQDYPVVVETRVDWGDMDAFQHVNNVVYFRYFENARVEYGERINITDRMKSEGLGPILGWTDCKYIRPMTFPDTAITGVRLGGVQDSRMKLEYKIVSDAQGEVTAVGASIGVFYDYRKGEKVDFPEELVLRIEKLEDRPVRRSIE